MTKSACRVLRPRWAIPVAPSVPLKSMSRGSPGGKKSLPGMPMLLGFARHMGGIMMQLPEILLALFFADPCWMVSNGRLKEKQSPAKGTESAETNLSVSLVWSCWWSFYWWLAFGFPFHPENRWSGAFSLLLGWVSFVNTNTGCQLFVPPRFVPGPHLKIAIESDLSCGE